MKAVAELIVSTRRQLFMTAPEDNPTLHPKLNQFPQNSSARLHIEAIKVMVNYWQKHLFRFQLPSNSFLQSHLYHKKNRKESKQRLMMILLDIKRKESWEKNWKITCVDHLISAYLQELAKRSWSKVDTPMSNQNIILCDLLEIKLIRFSLSVLCLLSSLIRLRANDSPS